MAAKFFTGLPLDGPDPECVLGHGEHALDALGAVDHAPAVAGPLGPAPPGAGRPHPAPHRPDRRCDREPAWPRLRRARHWPD